MDDTLVYIGDIEIKHSNLCGYWVLLKIHKGDIR